MSPRTVTVDRLWPETPLLTGVRLESPDAVRKDHTTPGQVIAVETADGKKTYLALASAPGDAQLELLVAPNGMEQIGLHRGQTLTIEGPFGTGFPLDRAVGKDVFLFAVGSAMAPIRPLVEMIRKSRSDYGRVCLYVGAMTPDGFAYGSWYDHWSRDRIDIVRVLHPEFVQDAFASDPLSVDDCEAYVCGMKEMMDGVEAVLARFGLDPSRVHRNW